MDLQGLTGTCRDLQEPAGTCRDLQRPPGMSREIFRKLLRVLRNLKGFLGADLMRVKIKYLFLSLF